MRVRKRGAPLASNAAVLGVGCYNYVVSLNDKLKAYICVAIDMQTGLNGSQKNSLASVGFGCALTILPSFQRTWCLVDRQHHPPVNFGGC